MLAGGGGSLDDRGMQVVGGRYHDRVDIGTGQKLVIVAGRMRNRVVLGKGLGFGEVAGRHRNGPGIGKRVDGCNVGVRNESRTDDPDPNSVHRITP